MGGISQPSKSEWNTLFLDERTASCAAGSTGANLFSQYTVPGGSLSATQALVIESLWAYEGTGPTGVFAINLNEDLQAFGAVLLGQCPFQGSINLTYSSYFKLRVMIQGKSINGAYAGVYIDGFGTDGAAASGCGAPPAAASAEIIGNGEPLVNINWGYVSRFSLEISGNGVGAGPSLNHRYTRWYSIGP